MFKKVVLERIIPAPRKTYEEKKEKKERRRI